MPAPTPFFLFILFVLCSAGPVIRVQAQDAPPPPAGGIAGGFQLTHYDDQNNRVLSQISATSAAAKGREKLLLSNMVLETYSYRTGSAQTEALIKAPECLFDNQNQTASSDGPITVTSSDNFFQLSGKGWKWDPDNGILVISNNIRTLVYLEEASSTPATPPSPVQVESNTFEYDVNQGTASYLGEVSLTDPERMKLMTSRLDASVESLSTEVKQIKATRDVVIELVTGENKGRITGEKALYWIGQDEEVHVDIIDQTTWEFPQARGSAEELSMNITTQSYTATGNGSMELNTVDLSFDKIQNSDPTPSNELTILVTFNKGFLNATSATFEGMVEATQGDRFMLSCGELTATLDPNNSKARDLQATHNARLRVQVEEGEAEIQGDSMHYTELEPGRSQLKVDGNARWRTSEYRGSSHQLEIRWQESFFKAAGDARLTWQIKPSESQDTSKSSSIDVWSDTYTLQGHNGHFEGNLRVLHPDWNLTGGSIDLELDPDTRSVKEVVARDKIQLVLNSPITEASTASNDSSSGLAGLGALGRFEGNWVLDTEELTLTRGSTESALSVSARGGVVLKNRGHVAKGGLLDWEQESGILILGDQPIIVTENGASVRGGKWTTFALNNVRRTFTARGAYTVQAPVRHAE